MGVIEFLNIVSYYKAKQKQIEAEMALQKLKRG